MSLGYTLVFFALAVGQFEEPAVHNPVAADAVVIHQKLDLLNERLAQLKKGRENGQSQADVEICAKAAGWILRHREFFEPAYSQWTIEVLNTGLRRASELGEGKPLTLQREGSTVLGYYSEVDESVQPYAVTLPRGYDPDIDRRWPLHVVLHGRNAKLNEVSFIHEFDGMPTKDGRTWIQLDVFGRTNNAYRWSGEADVFEAMSALKRRVRIDDSRITLRGFSMGGAGTWHIGLHYPSLWSSIGAGAGFVETVHHLKLASPLSPLHQQLTKIYDAQEYALNAFNVPTIGYGGELDPQLFAAKTMHAKGQELGVPIELLIGPETAHKFHPDSLKKYMEFLATHTRQGRLPFPNPAKLKFITYTLKYNHCDWMTIEELIKPYEPTVVEAEIETQTKTISVHTKNVAMLQISRNVADMIGIDGSKPLSLQVAEGNSPVGIYFEKRPEGWTRLDATQTRQYTALGTEPGLNPEGGLKPELLAGGDLRKRHNLQGPIDDAFMQPFVCVRPTGIAWSDGQTAWGRWTLERFEREFNKRLRGQVPVIDDTQVTDTILATKNLALFGDPGSNATLAMLVDKLPVKWMKDRFEVRGQTYSSAEHGLVMIYPNPLNPRKYVVINSGHTFHETEFVNSNANLYPRLGDIGVIKFTARSDRGFDETVLFSDLFNSRWQLEMK